MFGRTYVPSFGYSRAPRRAPQNAAPAVVEAFKAANPEVCEWIERKRETFDFAGSLAAGLNRYGSLTENQLAAARRCMDKDRQFEADRAERAATAPEVSILAIATAFDTARRAGVNNASLCFADVRFGQGRNGTIWVNDRHSRDCLGKVEGGKFLRFAKCDREREQEILAICADPLNSALAYGKRFGKCAACNRTLTDPASIERGIGPVCATYYGWGE